MNFGDTIKAERIRTVMTQSGITVPKDSLYQDVVRKLQEEEKFCAVVLEGNKVVGVFTERDALKRGLLKNMGPATPIEKIMTPNPTVIDMDDSVAVAIRLMHQGKHRHLPVVNAKREYQGLVSVRDIVFFLSENYPYDVFNQPPDPNKFSNVPEGA